MKFRSILFCAALALIPAGCKREPTSARVDAAIAPLLPPDVVLLAGLRLDKLQKTPFFEHYVKGEQALQYFREFQQRTGLDPRKDLWELDFAYSPKTRLVFARGKFGG